MRPAPFSWLQIEQGWQVVSADGNLIGTVAQVAGDQQSDIFDGLAVETGQPTRVVYLPGEQAAAIYPGKVNARTTAAQATTLEPDREAPRQTTLRPGAAPLTARILSWLRKR